MQLRNVYNSGYVYLDLYNNPVIGAGTHIDGIYKRCTDVYNSGKLVLLVNTGYEASPYPVMIQRDEEDPDVFDIYGYPVDGYFSVNDVDIIKLVTE